MATKKPSTKVRQMQASESKQVHGVGTKGLTVYIVTTILTYKTKDKYNGYLVKVQEKPKDDSGNAAYQQ